MTANGLAMCRMRHEYGHIACVTLGGTGYEKQNLIMRKIHINNDDNYATPPEFYKELDQRFNFDFDPCPYCEGKVVDGLSIE